MAGRHTGEAFPSLPLPLLGEMPFIIVRKFSQEARQNKGCKKDRTAHHLQAGAEDVQPAGFYAEHHSEAGSGGDDRKDHGLSSMILFVYLSAAGIIRLLPVCQSGSCPTSSGSCISWLQSAPSRTCLIRGLFCMQRATGVRGSRKPDCIWPGWIGICRGSLPRKRTVTRERQ